LVRVAHEASQPTHHLVPLKRLALAVIIQREGRVSETRQALRSSFGMPVEAGPLMAHEHARPRPGLALFDGQVPDHAPITSRVLDVFDPHSPSRTRSPCWIQVWHIQGLALLCFGHFCVSGTSVFRALLCFGHFCVSGTSVFRALRFGTSMLRTLRFRGAETAPSRPA